jgi:hypothetical protein
MKGKKVIDKRFCYSCNSSTTQTSKKGYQYWYIIDENTVICRKCYKSYYKQKQRPETVQRANARNNPISNERRRFRHQAYRGMHIAYLHDIRCGVCNWCRAIKGIDTSDTQLHHDENRYDDNNPLRFTLELCAECHGKEGHRLRLKKAGG